MKTTQFYIDGAFVDPSESRTLDVINPATEEPIAKISLGTAKDVDRAVAAARRAFATFSETSREERIALLEKIIAAYQKRMGDMATAITQEMGAPQFLATRAQAPSGLAHFNNALQVLKEFKFEEMDGPRLIRYEPVGVCGFITPWNWPVNQIACKVAPALAVGCTMVLKPSEIAPLSAHLLAEILHDAGVPKGVFNLVDGDGPTVGAAISAHPGIDMVSFTGSTRAGIEVARNAAPTIKRVTQELGGKSPNIILDDADLEKAVAGGVVNMMSNTGQSCNAPSRMLVPKAKHDQAVAVAKAAAEKIKFGDPANEATRMGPLASEAQFNKVQGLIKKGIEEGATLVTGGPGRPDGFAKGYYAKPTVFANVRNDMTIAQEEIFGPVLVIIPYTDEAEAIRIANDTPYGLSSYVSGEPEHARKVASKIRAGNVHLNNAGPDFGAPFGGYKMSGNGREWGRHGFDEFLETKAVLGAKIA